MRIVVNEYPKSGGSWVVGLLADALRLDKRDIYIADGYSAFEVGKHPWYAGASSFGLTGHCVIKTHERPGSPLLAFPARHVHLVRDGRDVVVSKYFFERDFCVKNGIYERFDEPFDEYVPRVARDWREFVEAWRRQPDVAEARYEEFLRAPGEALGDLLSRLDLDAEAGAIARAVAMNTKERFNAALAPAFSHNTFVRKGVAGDWRNHFESAHEAAFLREAGALLEQLGYCAPAMAGGSPPSAARDNR